MTSKIHMIDQYAQRWWTYETTLSFKDECITTAFKTKAGGAQWTLQPGPSVLSETATQPETITWEKKWPICHSWGIIDVLGTSQPYFMICLSTYGIPLRIKRLGLKVPPQYRWCLEPLDQDISLIFWLPKSPPNSFQKFWNILCANIDLMSVLIGKLITVS